MSNPFAPFVLESFSAGYAVHGPDTISDSAMAAFETACAIALERNDPNVLYFVAEIAKYEGLMATLALRREALSTKYAKKIAPIPKTVAANFDTAAFIAAAHKELAAHSLGPDKNDQEAHTLRRQAISKTVALAGLRSFLSAHPELAKQWTTIVSNAEAEAQAEGVVQATALRANRPATATPPPLPEGMPDLNDLYTRTLKALRELDSFGSQAPAWITQQLDGLAGDMGKAIADGIVRGFTQDEIVEYVNKIIDKGLGAQRYIDESIHYAMQQAAIAQNVAQGIDLFDYIAMPGACPICAPLDSSIVGPYTAASLPVPPMHINCRCLTDVADTTDFGGSV